MRRAVLSTFFFVAILGLGCMSVAVPGRADADQFDGHWMGTGTIIHRAPIFPTHGDNRDFEICGDFRTSFEVRGGKFQGTLNMTGDVPTEYSVRGEILDDGSLENVRVERVDDRSTRSGNWDSNYASKFEYLGALARGRWELKRGGDWDQKLELICSGTYVAQNSKAGKKR